MISSPLRPASLGRPGTPVNRWNAIQCFVSQVRTGTRGVSATAGANGNGGGGGRGLGRVVGGGVAGGGTAGAAGGGALLAGRGAATGAQPVASLVAARGPDPSRVTAAGRSNGTAYQVEWPARLFSSA
ncbi:hypothetical protein Lfu02_34030 [Longispora fulva]|nr:hypothetical protein Lfu02_34030 [Longispora fulva]